MASYVNPYSKENLADCPFVGSGAEKGASFAGESTSNEVE
jgi:hypothetical protein